NTMSLQYERDVDIAYLITTQLVRSSLPQPYTATNANTLLTQLTNQWNANHGAVVRDVVHLFTGKDIDGTTIGLANLGVICNLSGAYGFAQSDFSNNLMGATDVSAHEVGH